MGAAKQAYSAGLLFVFICTRQDSYTPRKILCNKGANASGAVSCFLRKQQISVGRENLAVTQFSVRYTKKYAR